MQKQSFIIVTLALDEEMIVYFNRLRQLYYPKHCNYLDAHLTLFHKLPYPNTSILDTIETICNCPTFYVQIASLKNMGKGVAFEILSEELSALHQKMQIALDAYLIKKDRQVLWPHTGKYYGPILQFKTKYQYLKLPALSIHCNKTLSH